MEEGAAMTIPPIQRHAIGVAKIDLLEAAGYVWQDTIPGAFRHPVTGHTIDYSTLLECSFSELAMLTARPKP